MKKFMAFVMIVTIGMFCSLGCTQQTPSKTKPKPPAEGTDKPAADKPAEPGDKPAADQPAEPGEKPAEDKPVE